MTPTRRIFLFLIGFFIGALIVSLSGCKTMEVRVDRWETRR